MKYDFERYNREEGIRAEGYIRELDLKAKYRKRIAILVILLSAAVTASARCGYERWAVKTGQDATAITVSAARHSSIDALIGHKSPLPIIHSKYPPQINTRFDSEKRQVTISATIIRYRVEADSDLHLILSDGKHTMIAEIPDPDCMSNLAGKKNMGVSPWVQQVTQVRTDFLTRTGYVVVPWSSGYGPPYIECNIPVSITGVVFFDWPHNQPGAAASNAVELHPITAIAYQ